MKTENELRVLLNMTQQEMAEFLDVSRSHYSMYELGKRDLPMKATQLLAALLTKVQLPKITAKSLSIKASAPQQTEKRRQLERLQIENEYQQSIIAKKINDANKKHGMIARRLLLIDFLSDNPESLSITDAMINTIIKKASRSLDAVATEAAVLLQLEIRQEVLAFEKVLLEKKFRETS